MEFFDPNADSCNEGDPQMNVALLKSLLKRRLNPRFFGDCFEKDLKSPRTAARIWQIATKTINNQRRKIQSLHRQVHCLKRQVMDMKSFIVELKEKQMISDQPAKIISVRN